MASVLGQVMAKGDFPIDKPFVKVYLSTESDNIIITTFFLLTRVSYKTREMFQHLGVSWTVKYAEKLLLDWNMCKSS